MAGRGNPGRLRELPGDNFRRRAWVSIGKRTLLGGDVDDVGRPQGCQVLSILESEHNYSLAKTRWYEYWHCSSWPNKSFVSNLDSILGKPISNFLNQNLTDSLSIHFSCVDALGAGSEERYYSKRCVARRDLSFQALSELHRKWRPSQSSHKACASYNLYDPVSIIPWLLLYGDHLLQETPFGYEEEFEEVSLDLASASYAAFVVSRSYGLVGKREFCSDSESLAHWVYEVFWDDEFSVSMIDQRLFTSDLSCVSNDEVSSVSDSLIKARETYREILEKIRITPDEIKKVFLKSGEVKSYSATASNSAPTFEGEADNVYFMDDVRS